MGYLIVALTIYYVVIHVFTKQEIDYFIYLAFTAMGFISDPSNLKAIYKKK